jgi:hypothetical protein
VELCTHRFRLSVVDGIADQEMPEPKAVLARNLRRARLDEALADERGQPRPHLDVARRERLDRPAVEELALDRGTLEHGPLDGLELIQPCRQQSLQRRRHANLALRLAGHRQHLQDEQRVATRRALDALAEPTRDLRRDELLDVCVRQRIEPECDGPGRP